MCYTCKFPLFLDAVIFCFKGLQYNYFVIAYFQIRRGIIAVTVKV